MYDKFKATVNATWRALFVVLTTIHKLDLKRVLMVAELKDQKKNKIK